LAQRSIRQVKEISGVEVLSLLRDSVTSCDKTTQGSVCRSNTGDDDSESDDELEESGVAPTQSWGSVGKELERGVSSELRSCSGKSVSRMSDPDVGYRHKPCRTVLARLVTIPHCISRVGS